MLSSFQRLRTVGVTHLCIYIYCYIIYYYYIPKTVWKRNTRVCVCAINGRFFLFFFFIHNNIILYNVLYIIIRGYEDHIVKSEPVSKWKSEGSAAPAREKTVNETAGNADPFICWAVHRNLYILTHRSLLFASRSPASFFSFFFRLQIYIPRSSCAHDRYPSYRHAFIAGYTCISIVAPHIYTLSSGTI